VPCRIRAEFAQPSLVSAFKLLLAEALKDPRNSMFLLVSETCIPLHHPALFYAQLMAESHLSRVNNGIYNPQRWFHRMATSHLRPSHFQKSDQWVSLTRMHADLVVRDTHVWSQFQRYCKSQVRRPGHPVCVRDVPVCSVPGQRVAPAGHSHACTCALSTVRLRGHLHVSTCAHACR
jgi:hypothetical protein